MCFRSPNHARSRAFRRAAQNTIHAEYVKVYAVYRRFFGSISDCFLCSCVICRLKNMPTYCQTEKPENWLNFEQFDLGGMQFSTSNRSLKSATASIASNNFSVNSFDSIMHRIQLKNAPNNRTKIAVKSHPAKSLKRAKTLAVSRGGLLVKNRRVIYSSLRCCTATY